MNPNFPSKAKIRTSCCYHLPALKTYHAMALPYPEGEVFFKRSVIKNNDNGLNPDNLASFNSHALVEWCWNDEVIGNGFGRNRICHVSGKHSDKEQYGYWESMIVMFGSKEGFENSVQRQSDGFHYSRHSGIKRMIKTRLPDGTEQYEKRAKGGPVLAALTPIKLDPAQPYMYIDLNVPIRAVYFPLAQKPSTMFPDLCSYLMVDFRMRQGVRMYDVIKQDREELMHIESIKNTEKEARKQIEEMKHPQLKKRLEQNFEEYLEEREWEVNETGHRVKKVNFDHYRGLVGLSDCEYIDLYNASHTLCPVTPFEKPADPCQT
jgi:hypothetical protein